MSPVLGFLISREAQRQFGSLGGTLRRSRGSVQDENDSHPHTKKLILTGVVSNKFPVRTTRVDKTD